MQKELRKEHRMLLKIFGGHDKHLEWALEEYTRIHLVSNVDTQCFQSPDMNFLQREHGLGWEAFNWVVFLSLHH